MSSSRQKNVREPSEVEAWKLMMNSMLEFVVASTKLMKTITNRAEATPVPSSEDNGCEVECIMCPTKSPKECGVCAAGEVVQVSKTNAYVLTAPRGRTRVRTRAPAPAAVPAAAPAPAPAAAPAPAPAAAPAPAPAAAPAPVPAAVAPAPVPAAAPAPVPAAAPAPDPAAAPAPDPTTSQGKPDPTEQATGSSPVEKKLKKGCSCGSCLAEAARRAIEERYAAQSTNDSERRAAAAKARAEKAAAARERERLAEEAAKEAEKRLAEAAAKEREKKLAEEAAKEAEKRLAEAAAKEREKKLAEEAAKEAEKRLAEAAAKEKEKSPPVAPVKEPEQAPAVPPVKEPEKIPDPAVPVATEVVLCPAAPPVKQPEKKLCSCEVGPVEVEQKTAPADAVPPVKEPEKIPDPPVPAAMEVVLCPAAPPVKQPEKKLCSCEVGPVEKERMTADLANKLNQAQENLTVLQMEMARLQQLDKLKNSQSAALYKQIMKDNSLDRPSRIKATAPNPANWQQFQNRAQAPTSSQSSASAYQTNYSARRRLVYDNEPCTTTTCPKKQSPRVLPVTWRGYSGASSGTYSQIEPVMKGYSSGKYPKESTPLYVDPSSADPSTDYFTTTGTSQNKIPQARLICVSTEDDLKKRMQGQSLERYQQMPKYNALITRQQTQVSERQQTWQQPPASALTTPVSRPFSSTGPYDTSITGAPKIQRPQRDPRAYGNSYGQEEFYSPMNQYFESAPEPDNENVRQGVRYPSNPQNEYVNPEPQTNYVNPQFVSESQEFEGCYNNTCEECRSQH